jgi:hypothetical protein
MANCTTPSNSNSNSRKPHALKLDDLPQTPNRLAETKQHTATR